MSSLWKSDWITNNVDTTTTDVTVPRTGWYGLFFETNDNDEWTFRVTDCNERIEDVSLPIQALGRAVTKSDTGHLIYLKESSNVKVVASTKTNNNCKWRIVFHHTTTTQPALSTRDSLTMIHKRLVCGQCYRSFHNWDAITSHLSQSHQALQNYPHWWTKTKLVILYQDDYLAVIDKPQGIPVQGDRHTLCKSDLLMQLSVPTIDQVLKKPRPVHRLDAATGGILVLAKTKLTESRLKAMFAERKCHKVYLALVNGHVQQKEGVIDVDIDNKPSKTVYRVVKYVNSAAKSGTTLTLLELEPTTGRRHQIRKHCKSIGHSIYGDKRYSGKRIDTTITTATGPSLDSRLCLWATQISLVHPVTKVDLMVKIDFPKWLAQVIEEFE